MHAYTCNVNTLPRTRDKPPDRRLQLHPVKQRTRGLNRKWTQYIRANVYVYNALTFTNLVIYVPTRRIMSTV